MTNVVATKSESRALAPVEQFERKLQLARSQFKAALTGSEIDPERFIRVARTAVQLNPEILECEEASIFGAFMTAAQLHFEPDPNIAHGDIIVRMRNGRKYAVWQTRYGGFIELAWRSGEMMSLQVNVVHEKDEFAHEQGLEEKLVHVKARGDRGAWTDVYCIARFRSGGHHIEVMSKADVLAIRDQYSDGWKAYAAKKIRSTPWSTAETEQAKKTVVRRARKYWPRSIQDNRRMVNADRLAEVVEAGGTGYIENSGELVYNLPDDVALPEDDKAEPAKPETEIKAAQTRLDDIATRAPKDPPKQTETVDPETGEILGENLFGELSADACVQIRTDFTKILKAHTSADEIQRFMSAPENAELLGQLQAASPKDYAAVLKAVDEKRATLAT